MQSAILNQATALLGASASQFQQLAGSASNREAVDAAAEEFEAVMLTAMLKPVFESIKIAEPFGGGQGEEMWRGLLVEEYAKEMAAAGGIGIADQVRAEMLRIQEEASSTTAGGVN